jgi:hypothetical protein
MSIWGDLTAIGDRRGAKSTAFVLMEHSEKLRASLALRSLHTPGSTLIDASIRRVLQERAVELTNDKLTHQDLFYRHISAIGDFFPCFLDVVCETVANMSGSPSDKVKPISNASNFIIAMTNAARDYRARNIELLEHCENSFETLPWIAVIFFFKTYESLVLHRSYHIFLFADTWTKKCPIFHHSAATSLSR